MKGSYKYFTSEKSYVKGCFNIYQAKNGAIVLLMNNRITILSSSQVSDLSINVYELKDFDYNNYIAYYNI